MHYGLPDDVSLHDPELVPRFVAFAEAVADALLPLTPGVPVFNLINEISYLSWVASCAVEPDTCAGDAATRDEVPSAASRRSGARVTQPASSRTSGYLIKRRLVQATLAAMQALHRRDSRIRFLHVEPVVHVVAPRDRPGLRGLARRVRSYQWQVWDMLAGRLAPELGGHPAALDLIGVNHYHSGQWEVGTEARLLWHEGDPRRQRLSQLLGEVHARYGRPMIIAEASHFGAGRCAWLDEVAAETKRARDAGLPLEGLCLYPVLDRPDWDDPTHWHHSGLWEVAPPEHVRGQNVPAEQLETRRLHTAYAATLARWQRVLPHVTALTTASRWA
jgi:hypothetical protein